MLNELYSTTTEPLHRRIRITRRALELSQLELALHIGVSQSQFSLFEHGYLGLGEQRARKDGYGKVRRVSTKDDAALLCRLWNQNVELRAFSPVDQQLQCMPRHSLLHMSRCPGLSQIVELADFICTLLPIGALLGIRIYAEFSLAINMNQGLHCQTVAMIG
jgi:hypothetical protein